MSRQPPALLYLTIYNPALRPSAPPSDDDEDAEEQAQILFYTAREHAVSRDRILRQVGLAKALINFSDMFAEEECEDVHSQSRRMIMVSPEPGFWMHACLELSKTPRSGPSVKGKERGKGKAKVKDPKPAPESAFDYHDGATSDAALRAHLLRAHQTFQLTHGSFTSVLRDHGQQALELQLERFFTPWAWNWDIEQDVEFGSYLGTPTHPSIKAIVPLLDDFLEQSLLPETAALFLLAPPYIIPSTSYTTSRLPPVLPLHLRKRIPPPPPPPQADPPAPDAVSAEQESKAKEENVVTSGAADVIVEGTREAFNATGNAFVAVGNAMDVRRWNWGYLTFGKSSAAKIGDPYTANVSAETSTSVEAGKAPSAQVEGTAPGDASAGPETVDEGGRTGADDAEALVLPEAQVDRESLVDAMGSLGSEAQEHTPPDVGSERDRSPMSNGPDLHAVESSHDETTSSSYPGPPPVDLEAADTGASPLSPDTSPSTSEPIELPPESPPPSPLLRLHVHIAEPDRAENTSSRHLLYRTYEGLALGLLADPESLIPEEEMTRLSALSSNLIRQAKKALDEDNGASPQTPLYSATKILQPKDKFAFTKGQGRVLASTEFVSRSEHLFAAQELVSNADILEVFSRTQGPQHWHAARRELDAAVFMEVSRKETSLTDVEDELLGVLRRCRDAA
ncbi:unnamed protein product [Peniophora sp. CBMAI 1063]|nr:unnamed protein product [Peniophora sp. CBMAI 1063]